MKYDPSHLRRDRTALMLRAWAFTAADVVQEYGLAKNILVDRLGRVCLYGALRMAAGYRPDYFFPEGNPFRLITLALNEFLGIKGGEQANVEWNNAVERTAADVAAALRGAARLIFDVPSLQKDGVDLVS